MGIWSKSGIDDDSYDIADWLDDDSETEWCMHCREEQKVEWENSVEICEACREPLNIGDEWATPSTSKTEISAAPTISKTGDIWGRSKGYTWGSGTSWWQRDSAYGGSMSGMWGGATTYGGIYNAVDNSAYRMNKHKTHLDSICKVVDPTVKHTLAFANHSSACTNMNTGEIFIDGSLLKESDDNLDITAGLAIHEKLHLIHTKPLLKWEKDFRYEKNLTQGESELLHSLTNIVEDEYIEQQLHKTCAGFVEYIDAVKKHYFDSEEHKIKELSEKHRFGDLINTLLLLVRYPSMIDAKRRHRHKRHITFFAKALKRGLKNRKATIKCIDILYHYLRKCADTMTSDDEDLKDIMKSVDDKMSSMMGRFSEDGVDLSPEEWEEIRKRFLSEAKKAAKHMDKLSKLFPEEMRELIRDLTGERDKDRLDKALLDKMVELEETDYEEMDLDKGIALPRQGKVSWQRVKSSSRSKGIYDEDRKSVAPAISKLRKKIRLYGNDQIYNIYNQKRGRLDKRRLHKIPMGVTDIFKAQIRKQDKPLDICLLVDESGSMGYRAMDDARKAAIAVKEALCDNPMLNLWVFGHSADRKATGMTEMREYYSPTMKDRPFSMGDMRARCENRDGAAIVASANRVKEQSDQPHANKLMIVFSDGSPSADMYRGETAIKHTRKCVKYTEARGWNIIQIGFSGAHEYYMKKMFTNWIYIDNTNTLGDQTAKIIRKVLKI